MRRHRPLLVALSLGALALCIGLGSQALAAAENPLRECFGPGPLTLEESQMTCVKQGDGEWEPVGGPSGNGGSDALGALLALGMIFSLFPAFVGYFVADSQKVNPWAGAAAGLLFTWVGVFGIYLYGRSLNQPTPAPSSDPDPADRLRRLQQLLNDGLITQQEFDERRSAALDAV